MTEESATLWPPRTISIDPDLKPPDCASCDEGGMEDQWISDFIKRLACAIGDIGRKQ
jgi:hypothetical protein